MQDVTPVLEHDEHDQSPPVDVTVHNLTDPPSTTPPNVIENATVAQDDEFLSPAEEADCVRRLTALRATNNHPTPTLRPTTTNPLHAYSNPVYSPAPVPCHASVPNVPAVNAPRQQHTSLPSGSQGTKQIRFNVSNNSNGPQATTKSGTINLSIPFPTKFNPDKDNWLLWKSSVEMFIDRIGLNRSILQDQHADLFTMEEHSTVLGVLTQVAPDTDGLWFTKLGLQWAHEAWDELSRSYGQRAAIAVQQKLLDFDNTTQRPGESIKNWVVRLRREVKEISLMGSEVVPSNTHKIKLLRVISTPGNELLFRNFLASVRTRLHLLSLSDLEDELINFEEGLNAEQDHQPTFPYPINNMMHTGSTSNYQRPRMQQPNGNQAPRTYVTFNRKPEWTWRPIFVSTKMATTYGVQAEDLCRICYQAKKPLKGCIHATNTCFELNSEFGQQVVDHLKSNPQLDHVTPQRRVVPGE